MYQGIVKSYSADKGYGFIDLPQNPEEDSLFFHASALQGAFSHQLKAGQKLRFEIAEGERGPQAVNIHLDQ
ncbi:cold-shock protein [Aerococcus sanguinicola]|uniref:Cold shock domain-containing protein n=1 Tax=Aerococcus sanguinicola TaxID=119206 RepID=A0A120I913_9LACT|nr:MULTISPECIES: cold shock domain-containing protein [Aerococcus]AMB93491.1 cold-shock protein [Aerococcus sanguinicola]MDK7050707.1 cold shock domain-containing protein [Aerococcus sanguinicola]OFT97654.1 cold-shock protein [Aerococcus sp. HMSC23C02]PKZ21780.1 cold shock domain-containing protein [Aerococcus sanguinicola]